MYKQTSNTDEYLEDGIRLFVSESPDNKDDDLWDPALVVGAQGGKLTTPGQK